MKVKRTVSFLFRLCSVKLARPPRGPQKASKRHPRGYKITHLVLSTIWKWKKWTLKIGRSSALSRHCFLWRWRAALFWFLHSMKYGTNTDAGQIPPPSNLTSSSRTTSSNSLWGTLQNIFPETPEPPPSNFQTLYTGVRRRNRKWKSVKIVKIVTHHSNRQPSIKSSKLMPGCHASEKTVSPLLCLCSVKLSRLPRGPQKAYKRHARA